MSSLEDMKIPDCEDVLAHIQAASVIEKMLYKKKYKKLCLCDGPMVRVKNSLYRALNKNLIVKCFKVKSQIYDIVKFLVE